MQPGPIVFIDDDLDDQEIYLTAMTSLKLERPVLVFNRCTAALEYLTATEDRPFIIFSDVNLPQMTGLQLKQAIEEKPFLKKLGIPFILISTTATPDAIREAGAMGIQGFFVKPVTIEETAALVKTILEYWSLSRHVNNDRR